MITITSIRLKAMN